MQRDKWLIRRTDTPELLDEGKVSTADAHTSLEDIRRLNYWLFGVRATLRPLLRQMGTLPKPLTIVDIGTGGGQMAQAVATWAAQHYQAVRVVGLDLVPMHLANAQQWNEREGTEHVQLVAGDALRLPFEDGGVDVVTSSLFIHHFSSPALEDLLWECRRVARRGIVMSDLWRHWLPYYLYKGLAQPLFVRSPITHYDGDASFRRAYTPDEMRATIHNILPGATVRLDFPSFRWVLEWWR